MKRSNDLAEVVMQMQEVLLVVKIGKRLTRAERLQHKRSAARVEFIQTRRTWRTWWLGDSGRIALAMQEVRVAFMKYRRVRTIHIIDPDYTMSYNWISALDLRSQVRLSGGINLVTDHAYASGR